MNISSHAVKDIKLDEQFREFAYPDPYSPLAQKYPRAGWGYKSADYVFAGLPESARSLSGAPWTLGYGFTKGVTPEDRITQGDADARFLRELIPRERAVEKGCTRRPTQGQFDAMVSLCYNIGVGGFAKSTVLRAHNRGDFPAASRAFGLWNKSKGKESKGLTIRRAREGAGYLAASPQAVESVARYQEDEGVQPDTPQNVDSERPMGASTINRASVAAGTTATIAGVSEVARTVSDAKSSVEGLGQWLVPVLCVAVVALCAYIIYERFRQRKEGWA